MNNIEYVKSLADGFLNPSEENIEKCVRLSYLTRFLIYELKKKNIDTVVLKGVSLAALYPMGAIRSFGDVDLYLLRSEDEEKALTALKELGLKVCANQDSAHHISLMWENRILVELHTSVVRDFENTFANEYIEKYFNIGPEKVSSKTFLGMEYDVLDAEHESVYITLHMLEHFLNAGFGVKLLYDYCLFWKNNESTEVLNAYLKAIKELKISGFSDLLSKTAFLCFDIECGKLPWAEAMPLSREDCGRDMDVLFFIDELSEGEDYGKHDDKRLVSLEDASIKGLFKEFNHQTRVNFPKAYGCVLIRPALWAGTLFIFLRNNRTVRKTSSAAIVKKAMERSRLSGAIELWRK